MADGRGSSRPPLEKQWWFPALLVSSHMLAFAAGGAIQVGAPIGVVLFLLLGPLLLDVLLVREVSGS